MKRAMHYTIDGQAVHYELEGESITGDDQILLKQDDDLTAHAAWHQAGYTLAPFLELAQFHALNRGIESLIYQLMEEEAGKAITPFPLYTYHQQVDDDLHAALISRIRGCFKADLLPIPRQVIEDRIGQICGISLTLSNPALNGDAYFCLRIVRPGVKADNNPPHRDVYLDHLRNGINVYAPLAGSNALSSLPVMPGSHLLSEAEIARTDSGAKINGAPFTVPCITAVKEDLALIRPDPHINEVMVFSPYLVHGGAININEDITRVSLEMRFFRK